MPSLGPVLVVVSSGARQVRDAARRARLLDDVVSAVRARGHGRVETATVPGSAGAAAAVRSAITGGTGLVIAVGGDGLIREVAEVVAGSEAILGIVPAGTGNLLAASLRLPRTPAAAARALATASPRRLDQGAATWTTAQGTRASGRFMVACGAGLDARLVGGASAEAKRRLGIGAYIVAAIGTAPTLRPRQTRIVVDGTSRDLRSVVVLVANAGELIPGLLRPRHPIRPDDGLFDVFVLHGGIVRSARGTLELLAAATPAVGGAGLRLQGHEVQVETDPPEPVELDGDVVGTSPLEARIVPGALSVLVPPGAMRA